MLLIKKDIDSRTGAGTVVLRPQVGEDMWHTYHLISKGDHVRALCVRRVQKESNTGSVSSERVKTYLTLEIDKIEFEPEAYHIRISGKNVEENKFVRLGAFHTADLELQKDFSIVKDEWDAISLERLDTATNPKRTADLGAVVMQEGLANICLISDSLTIVRARIEVTIPRKRRGSVTAHEKALRRFYEAILQGINQHMDFAVVKAVILASPGFVNQQFFEYINSEAQKRDLKWVFENREKFVLVHSSSGHKHALGEVLSQKDVSEKVANTKAASEVLVLDRFFRMMNDEPDRTAYGPQPVIRANEQAAIEILLVTDELFRAANIRTRKEYVKLVSSARENGAEVHVFSSMHVTGERLGQLTGVAAILRYPMPDIYSSDESESESDDEEEET